MNALYSGIGLLFLSGFLLFAIRAMWLDRELRSLDNRLKNDCRQKRNRAIGLTFICLSLICLLPVIMLLTQPKNSKKTSGAKQVITWREKQIINYFQGKTIERDDAWWLDVNDGILLCPLQNLINQKLIDPDDRNMAIQLLRNEYDIKYRHADKSSTETRELLWPAPKKPNIPMVTPNTTD